MTNGPSTREFTLEPDAPPARRAAALLILGMHRSGTSAVTRVLNLLGATLPQKLLSGLFDNPRGHWESPDFVAINDSLLRVHGLSWDTIDPVSPDLFDPGEVARHEGLLITTLKKNFPASSLFAVKDPRISRLLPVWLNALDQFGAQPRLIIMVRHPLDVALSIQVRNGYSIAVGLRLWLRYMLEAERYSRGRSRIFVPYTTLLDNWRDVAGRIATELDIVWPHAFDAAEAEISQFLTKELHHHRLEAQSRNDPLETDRAVWRVYEALRRPLIEGNLVTDELDAVFEETTRSEAEFERRYPRPKPSRPGLASLFPKIRLCRIQPQGYNHVKAFDELVLGLSKALANLGCRTETVVNASAGGDWINIVIGAHLLLPSEKLPVNSIIFNCEDLQKSIMPNLVHYVERLGQHCVLDYSKNNVEYIKNKTGNDNVFHFMIGFIADIAKIKTEKYQDIDVLLYGSINERRLDILKQLQSEGYAVKGLSNIYGEERDKWIARSKIILNIHFYGNGIHESVRTSYLLANRKAVVTECDANSEMDDDLRDAMAAVPYDRLIATCRMLAKDEAARRRLEDRGFEIFSRRNQAQILDALTSVLSRPHPNVINLGSGPIVSAKALDIDTDAKWKPDICTDIAAPGSFGQWHFSTRFGFVQLRPATFERIVALDTLQHVTDLEGVMIAALDLLQMGGILEVAVPHDLSMGAWSDPRAKRAFNENSLKNLCAGRKPLERNGTCFEVQQFWMTLSPYGVALKARGMPQEDIVRTPRAIDQIKAILVKRSMAS